MRRFIALAACLLTSPLLASEVVRPIFVSGQGTADYLSAIPGEFVPFGGTGQITFGSNSLAYTLTSADVGGLSVTNPGPPVIADFSNSIPVTFTSTDPNEPSAISMNYAGEVTLTPFDATQFMAVFVATFEPIVGSGTGVFSDVIGGSFEMTAITTQPFVPKLSPTQTSFSTDVPYVWVSTGGVGDTLTAIPEPSVWSMTLLIGGLVGIKRWKSRGAFTRESAQ